MVSLFPDSIEETLGPEDGLKRWRLRIGDVRPFLSVSAADVVSLEKAAITMGRMNRHDIAVTVRRIAKKLEAFVDPRRRNRFETDRDALIASESFVQTPGPRLNLDSSIPEEIRTAVLALKQLRIEYRKRGQDAARPVVVHPLGILNGRMPYLVAIPEGSEPPPKLYRLAGIEAAHALDRAAIWPDRFSLQDYSRNAFGVYQEPPFNVVWRFLPAAAREAGRYRFHPSQTVDPQEDGSLIVRFRAGGALEMVWHLATWGPLVEVIEPADLYERAEAHQRRLFAGEDDAGVDLLEDAMYDRF